MCRSIQKLRRPDQRATDDEVYAAALQFIRKVSGFNSPSQANRAVFDRAVAIVAEATKELLSELPSARPVKNANSCKSVQESNVSIVKPV